ncbi:MAG: hypothetical protein M1812_002663 [Candelaria pacifica]|nr:MAG: hypothetical protein M1812_002663 [Candelaria pacifica]
MRFITFYAAIAAVLPAFIGFTSAENFIEFFNGSSTAPAIDPAKLKARAMGSRALEARGFSSTLTYADVSSADHQSKFESLSSQGWRIISLDVSGDVSATKYAAVWAKTSGPGWVATHEASPQALQDFFDKYSSQGYVSTILKFVGTSDNYIGAMVMEKISVGSWECRFGLPSGDVNTPGTIEYYNAQALKNNLYPKTISIYGGAAGASARRYAVIYHENKNKIQWHMHLNDLDSNEGVGALGYEKASGFYPYYISGDQDSTVAAVYSNKPPGNYVFTGYDDIDTWQSEFNQYTAKNGYHGMTLYPYMLQVSGVGANSKYWTLYTSY